MQIAILGPLEVSDDGGPVELRGSMLRALLVRLAIDAGRMVTVPALAASLWDGEELADEVNALQSLVSRLRRSLPDPGVVESSPAGYRIAVDPMSIDAVRFSRLSREGRELLRAGTAQDAAASLRAALDLWRGTALADVSRAPFAPAEQARLEELRVATREDMAEALLALGRPADAVADLEALIAANPLRERPRKLLMSALHQDGRQVEALAAYEAARRTFAEELGADPSAELQAAHLELLRGDSVRTQRDEPDRGAGPPLPAPRAALTTFVGRDSALISLRHQLGEHRLITLVGPGGAGKTRLAAETANACATDFPGGIWLAALAPLDEPRDLAHAVTGVLGLRPRAFAGAGPAAPPPPREALQQLADAFAGAARSLLVLDNCEHLIEAAATLAEQLLLRCPCLHVLATSREPLGIAGELFAPVLPLTTPAADSSPQEALASASVRLFVDRAASVRPGFVVDEHNVAAVVEICRRLDGLPLALELAAARLRTLGVGQIAARLDDRFRLLTGGSRTALPRHRTLRAVVSWSWDLLDDRERTLAEQVAVFAGGVTPDSAAANPADDVLDLLAALVDKSLLQVHDPDEPRYRMLETIREFGIERLAERGELAATRRAHARYFRDLAEEADRHVRGSGQLPWIRLLHAERDNLAAALRYAADTEDADTAIRLVAGLGSYWTLIGSHDEALAWAGTALALPGPTSPVPRAVVVALTALSGAVTDAIPGDDDVKKVEEAIEAAGGIDAHPLFALLRTVIAFTRRDENMAALLVAEGKRARDPWARATLTLLGALMRQNNGDLTGMHVELLSARAQFEEIGDGWGIAMTSLVAGELHTFTDELDAAITDFTEAAAYMARLGAFEDEVLAYLRLSGLQAAIGRFDEARATVDVLAETARRSRWPRLLACHSFAEGMLARAQGQLAAARSWFEHGLGEATAGASVPAQLRSIALSAVAGLDAEEGDLPLARERLREAYALGSAAQDMPVLAEAVTGWALCRFHEGNAQEAARLLGLAVVVRGIEDRGPGSTRAVMGAVRAALGPDAFAKAYAEAMATPKENALTELDALAR